MNSKPLISIITVTFNAGSTLSPTLDSIKEQVDCEDGVDYECIVMDGKSSDNTIEIAEHSGIKALRIFSERDHGIYDAMNKAMDVARGQYLMFLNAGDSLHSPHTLRKIIDTIKASDYPGIVYGQTELVDADRHYVGQRHLTAPPELTYKSFANGMLVCHQAFIVHTKIATHYDLKYRFSADYEWCIRCLQHSRRNVYIDDVLIDYLSEGVTTKNRYASLRERFSIMCYYYGTTATVLRHLSFVPRFVGYNLKSKQS